MARQATRHRTVGTVLTLALTVIGAANAEKPAAPNGVGSIAEYERQIGERGLLLESENIQMWVPRSYEEHSRLIFQYLNKGCDALSEIFGGHKLSVRFSIELYPPGNPHGWGGTDARGTIQYD